MHDQVADVFSESEGVSRVTFGRPIAAAKAEWGLLRADFCLPLFLSGAVGCLSDCACAVPQMSAYVAHLTGATNLHITCCLQAMLAACSDVWCPLLIWWSASYVLP